MMCSLITTPRGLLQLQAFVRGATWDRVCLVYWGPLCFQLRMFCLLIVMQIMKVKARGVGEGLACLRTPGLQLEAPSHGLSFLSTCHCDVEL